MPWRSLLRRKRRDRRGREAEGLTEDDVQRLQRVQRASPSAVKVLRRDQ
jgi:hypothetical protein